MAIFRATHPFCTRNEFDFECQVGFGGVDHGSAEISLHLPGSDHWQVWFDDRVE